MAGTGGQRPRTPRVSDAVLGGANKILTHPRVFTPATTLDEALSETTKLREHAGVVTLAPGARHWGIFDRLCRTSDARGNLVADAQHAALAMEHGATWVSKDRDFGLS